MPTQHHNITLDYILTRSSLRYAFYEFLKSQHDEEHLDFLFEVDEFENSICELDGKESVVVAALRLYDRYIDDKGTKQINMSAEARSSFTAEFEHSVNLSDRTCIFRKLKTRVKVQLQDEKIRMFLNSKYYQEYLERNKELNSMRKYSHKSTPVQGVSTMSQQVESITVPVIIVDKPLDNTSSPPKPNTLIKVAIDLLSFKQRINQRRMSMKMSLSSSFLVATQDPSL
jgi:hypothetical protein